MSFFVGEVDVLEGINNNMVNQYTYHTGSSCLVDDSQKMTANILGTECEGGSGCGMTDQSQASFGKGFNTGGGGVFAHRRDSTGIAIWFFPRDQIPDDITSKTPDPSSWPTPASFLANGDKCDVPKSFVDHVLTFDVTLCGDWANNPTGYKSAGCGDSCAATVMDPSNYSSAYPLI